MMRDPFRIGSLFSGIGGLDLGLERALAPLNPRVVWQVERDEWCRAVLEKHWPDAERFDDVREVCGVRALECDLDEYCTETGILAPVDLLCGGFPCQDVSDSEGVGLAGHRSGLWFEMLRIVRELRPTLRRRGKRRSSHFSWARRRARWTCRERA